MPAVAPYRPVSPVGTMQLPFDSAPPGRLLSMTSPDPFGAGRGDTATSFVDRTSSSPFLARRGGAVEAYQSRERERQTPQEHRDAVLSEAGRFASEQLAELGPGAAAPSLDAPQAPGVTSFAAWMDRNYPDKAGRAVRKDWLQSAYQQYTAEQSARREMYRLNLARYQTQVRAAEYTARGNRPPSRGDLMGQFLRAGELGLGMTKQEQGPVPTDREAMDTWLERQAERKGGFPALLKRRKKVRPPGKGPRTAEGALIAKYERMRGEGKITFEQEIALLEGLLKRGGIKPLSFLRAVQERNSEVRYVGVGRLREKLAKEKAKKKPSLGRIGSLEDDIKWMDFEEGLLNDLRQQLEAGSGDQVARPTAQPRLMGGPAPSTPGAALPAPASSPFGAMGGVPDIVDDPAKIRDALRRGELTWEEAEQRLRAIGYEP